MRGGQHPRQVARRLGEDRIRRGGQVLQRAQNRVSAAAVGAHAHFQPVGATGEYARAEIKRRGEQPIARGHGIGQVAGADLKAAVRIIVKFEPEIIPAIRRIRPVIQPPLIRERRALAQAR